jgi:SET domain-containing protein
MILPQKQLFIKKSGIPEAGKGLFTKRFIAKGTRIIEYKGEITTWKKVLQVERETKILNKYLYYLNLNHVIDAMDYPKVLARYANDAKGLGKGKGLLNNCKYAEDKGRVFMGAIEDIPAGAELLISYGKEYWDTLKKFMHPASIS